MISLVQLDGNNLIMPRSMRRVVLYTLGVLMVAVSCINEQNLDVTPTPGKEVKFAADMNSGAVTKTLYGADTHPNPIKVKWVDGDKVKVFGTTCAVTTADYEVAASGTNTPNSDDGLNVAETLNRIGEVGVQWGTEPTSDFVAVYPSDNASFDYDSESGVVTATTTISSIQNYVFNDEPVVKTIGGKQVSVWEGTHFANDATNPSMQNAIMYAREDGVANGDEVGLTFKPYSTVLKFRFMGFDDLWDDAGDVYVSSITLTAPSGYNIAGDFELDIPRGVSDSNPVVAYSKEGATNLTNSITINTIKKGGSFLKLTEDQAVEFNVFTVPLSGLTISNNKLWTVSIKVEGVALPYIYEMVPLENGTYELVPGLIHKVKIPALVVADEPIWNPGNWITQIPKPVYISELSVPGAWYAGDLANYQESATLTQLYSNGVRAFHVDCRMSPGKWEDGSGWLSGLTPTGDNILVCAGTDKVSAVLGYVTSATVGTTVLSALQEISSQIRDDEYVVVVLSICEKPLDTSVGDWHETFGSINPADVIPAIKSLINTYGESLKVFGYYDHPTNTTIKTKGKVITKDTTVEDVLGSMIIKINTNTDAISSYEYPTSSLVSFASMASDPDYNVSGDVITDLAYDYFAKMQESNLYWSNSTSSSLKYYYHQAQKTRITENATATTSNPIPTIKDRKAAIDAIISNSKEIYDNAQHDVWFQMGIGGYNESNASDKTSVSSSLNSYLKTKIDAKMDTDPSPVGIVLMNNCLSSTDLIQSIIEMNGKFYLNRRGNDIVTGDGEQNGANQSAVTKSCGNATIGFDAF